MKAAEIKELSNTDIAEKIEDMQLAQEKLLLAHNISQLENPMELKENRKIIARLHTELNMRKAAEGTSEPAKKAAKAAPAVEEPKAEAVEAEEETKDEAEA